MKRTLAISHTVYPNYEEKSYWFGAMPQHPTNALDSQLFNRWANYIHNQNVKLKGWHLNKPRKGGVGYAEQQEKVLQMAKDLLK
jgi:hypothetical protein